MNSQGAVQKLVRTSVREKKQLSKKIHQRNANYIFTTDSLRIFIDFHVIRFSFRSRTQSVAMLNESFEFEQVAKQMSTMWCRQYKMKTEREQE